MAGTYFAAVPVSFALFAGLFLASFHFSYAGSVADDASFGRNDTFPVAVLLQHFNLGYSVALLRLSAIPLSGRSADSNNVWVQMLALGPCALDAARRRVSKVLHDHDFFGPRPALQAEGAELEGTLVHVADAADLSVEEAQQVVANVEMLLGVGKGPTTRATRFRSAFIGVLEQLVLDHGLAPYLRGVAWLRLVMVWAVLRCDDRSWLPPQRLAFEGGGLTGILGRAKISRAGRKMPEMLLAVVASVGGRLREASSREKLQQQFAEVLRSGKSCVVLDESAAIPDLARWLAPGATFVVQEAASVAAKTNAALEACGGGVATAPQRDEGEPTGAATLEKKLSLESKGAEGDGSYLIVRARKRMMARIHAVGGPGWASTRSPLNSTYFDDVLGPKEYDHRTVRQCERDGCCARVLTGRRPRRLRSREAPDCRDIRFRYMSKMVECDMEKWRILRVLAWLRHAERGHLGAARGAAHPGRPAGRSTAADATGQRRQKVGLAWSDGADLWLQSDYLRRRAAGGWGALAASPPRTFWSRVARVNRRGLQLLERGQGDAAFRTAGAAAGPPQLCGPPPIESSPLREGGIHVGRGNGKCPASEWCSAFPVRRHGAKAAISLFAGWLATEPDLLDGGIYGGRVNGERPAGEWGNAFPVRRRGAKAATSLFAGCFSMRAIQQGIRQRPSAYRLLHSAVTDFFYDSIHVAVWDQKFMLHHLIAIAGYSTSEISNVFALANAVNTWVTELALLAVNVVFLLTHWRRVMKKLCSKDKDKQQ
ncbi:unnamed protein product, partial [Prorocentrum cordatum]